MKTLQDMAAMKEEWNRKGFIGASVISAYAKMRLQDLDIVFERDNKDVSNRDGIRIDQLSLFGNIIRNPVNISCKYRKTENPRHGQLRFKRHTCMVV